jgi:hypothetical protein
MLSNIANIENFLNNEYNYLSLTHGAILWETGWINNIYSFGNIFPIYNTDCKNRVIINNYQQDMHAIVRIIHVFFNKKIASRYDSKLTPTDQLSLSHSQTLSTIAKLIHTYDWLQKNYGQYFAHMQAVSLSHNNDKRVVNFNLSPWNKQYMEAFLNAYNSQHIKDYFEQLFLARDLLRSLFNSIVFKKRENIGKIIFSSLKESHLYQKNFFIWVILAFVYKKYSHNESCLKLFYKEVSLLYKFDIGYYNTNVKSPFDHFNEYNLLKYSKELRNYPIPVGYAKTTYHYKVGFNTPAFSDCMGHCIHNFINLLLYNEHFNSFDVEKFPNINNELKSYIKKYQLADLYNIEANNDWVLLVSNLPFVAYNRSVNDQGILRVTPSLSNKGFIRVDHLNCDNNYLLLKTGEFGYEIQPSLKNLIIITDQLLGLNMFSDLNKEFGFCSFVKKYFPILCYKLSISCTGPDLFNLDLFNLEGGTVSDNIDRRDYTMETLTTYLKINNMSCKLLTNADHADFFLVDAPPIEKYMHLQNLVLKNMSSCQSETFYILATHILCKYKVSIDELPVKSLYLTLFAIKLDNFNLLREVPKRISELNFMALDLETKIAIKKFLLKLANIQEDPLQKILQQLIAHNIFIKNLNLNDPVFMGDALDIYKNTSQFYEKDIVDERETLFQNLHNIGLTKDLHNV